MGIIAVCVALLSLFLAACLLLELIETPLFLSVAVLYLMGLSQGRTQIQENGWIKPFNFANLYASAREQKEANQ